MSLTTAKRFTIGEYHRLAELGFFEENDRDELIKGEIIQMAAKGTPHSVCKTRLDRELYKLVGDRATLRGQQPITLSNNSEPEPDRIIAKNRDDDYLANHPSPSDILLLIEIADSSLKYDQEEKLPIYAEAGISNYWIFNLVDNYLECYRGASHLCKYRYNFGKKVTLATRAASAITMNPEDFKRLETCLQEAAEILYRNTPTEELTSFESIEKAVRTKMLEQVSPKIAFFLSNKSQEQNLAENE